MRDFLIKAAVAAAVLGAAGAAQASIHVYGGGLAGDCSQAAIAGRSDPGAADLCTRALEQSSMTEFNRAATLVNRGVVFQRQRRYAQAQSDFDAAVRVKPDLGAAYVNLGAALIVQRRFAEGIAATDRGLELRAQEPWKAYANRAYAREATGDLQGAYEDYRRAAELRPDWEMPRRELARFVVQRR